MMKVKYCFNEKRNIIEKECLHTQIQFGALHQRGQRNGLKDAKLFFWAQKRMFGPITNHQLVEDLMKLR